MARTATTKPADPATDTTNVKSTAVALPAIDYSADSGGGMEGADAASFAIPFLAVVQKTSPICDEADGAYDPNAKPGMLLNTVTRTLHDGKTGIILLPAHYQRRFLRWGPKGTPGSGFKGEMMPEDAAELERQERVVNIDGKVYFPLDDGTVNVKTCDRLADVRNHFCILEGSGENVLLSLGSTQIKKSKALMSMLAAVKVVTPTGRVTPPTWANRVRIQTVLEQNDQGSWHGVKFTLEGLTGSHADFTAAREFHQSLLKGTAGEVRYAEPDGAAAGTSDERF